jgi:5'-phosphate synthase pdxT subunit
MKIGVLALQGDFYLHLKRLHELGVAAIPVKKPSELEDCNGLIIPGGESTTLVKLLKNIEMFEVLPEFNQKWPIFGTCAGAILVSREVSNHPVEALNLIDISVERNSYGRQVDSFIDEIELKIGNKKQMVEAVFIRAPRFTRIGKGVRAIARHQNDVVMVENENILAATFHPELSENLLIHQYFVDKVRERG